METTLLNHYKLPSLDPSEWPADKDFEDSSDDEPVSSSVGVQKRASKSRYSALNRNATLRSSVPGAERSKDGKENLVQKDEPDPLGGSQSVIQVLRLRGLPIEDDWKLRNRFLLSSTTFSPPMFLSEVHNRASTDDLLRGLEFLSQSIEKKSASLKVLVESNFERFVKAKSTIDNVYKEMREHGQDLEKPRSPGSHSRAHSRQLSRNSVHFRRTSGNQSFSPGLTVDTNYNLKRKNALIKESDYGVLPIKVPLLELSTKVEELWGPALGGREKEESLKAVLACVEKNRSLFELGTVVRDAIKRRDNEALVEAYKSAKDYADQARKIVDSAVASRTSLKDADLHQVIVTARMWADIEEQIEVFKRDVWRRLAGTHFSKHDSEPMRKQDEHLELISILLELGVDDNPINIWLISRYDFLKTKIDAAFERMKVEVEILRRHVSNDNRPTNFQMASYLRNATPDGKLSKTDGIDAPRIIEIWEHIQGMLDSILSTNGGILGEVIEFWETAQGFIDGRTQRTLPIGIDGDSRKHHRLSTDGVKHLTSGALELVMKIREELRAFFAEPPPEDLSLLLSPLPPDSPMTPNSNVLSPSALSPVWNKFDPTKLPPPSPRRGESWEKYGFWPPYASSISGSYYLSKFLAMIGTASCEMAGLSVVKAGRNNVDDIKKTLGEIRERCLSATLAAWSLDSENCRMLEDWTRSSERHDLTNMPVRFRNFQGFLLSNIQQIMYISEASRRSETSDVIVPPSTKLLQGVRSQFVASIYRALRGMVQNAESPEKGEGTWDTDADGLIVRRNIDEALDGSSRHLDSSNKKIRILITLSNVQNLRNDIIPHLIAQFETNFSVQLTDESKSIQEALGKIDTDLFRFYTEPITKKLESIIKESITSPSWVPSPEAPRPEDAKPYVYEALLQLVLVHSEVSTTASPLTSPILKHLLEAISEFLMDAFKSRSQYSLAALRQATLDVEFLAQTMSNYTTDKASATQNAIYVALDERTDNEARLQLQGELQEMRSALKKLREKTRTEFACFKRNRSETVSSRGGKRE
ncbi:uncharacterized protein PV09_06485 [Verruconis gallopava]|uniref:Exocyst complex component SEC5 n=1 Tax=Verruconis gallopava TaxID=253628 RepID=A0A0D2AT65_9PEZI|nr:uncharacterized protein PV09_06485 [Verruconis gallopava]KIW02344.1 hypothetical protein PV09_06485 [Verruconis gallopava]